MAFFPFYRHPKNLLLTINLMGNLEGGGGKENKSCKVHKYKGHK